MMTKRKLFVIIWCAFSGVGMLLPNLYSTAWGYLLLGFNTPRDMIHYFMLYGLFSEYPEMIIVCVFLFVAFVATFTVALFRLKKSMLFEYLIVIDSFLAIAMFTLATTLNHIDFFEIWFIFAGLLIKSLVLLAILVSYKVTTYRDISSGLI